MGQAKTSTFYMVGQLVGYELKNCQICHVLLQSSSGEYRLKLDKNAKRKLLRAALQHDIQTGDWIKARVSRKVKVPKKAKMSPASGDRQWKVKLKVRSIEKISVPEAPGQLADSQTTWPSHERTHANEPQGQVTTTVCKASQVKVLICQKSGCCRRGGKAVYKTFVKSTEKKGLKNQFKIKQTGCLGKCGKGPNILVNKTPYHRMNPKAVKQLLESYSSAQES